MYLSHFGLELHNVSYQAPYLLNIRIQRLPIPALLHSHLFLILNDTQRRQISLAAHPKNLSETVLINICLVATLKSGNLT